jgi:hypothetical protein
MKEIIEDRGREVIYVSLHAVEPQFCDGGHLATVFVRILENILARSPGRLELVSFCGHCWKPIDPLLRELVQIPQAVQ